MYNIYKLRNYIQEIIQRKEKTDVIKYEYQADGGKMKKILIISGTVLAIVIAVTIFFNIKVDNGSYKGGFGEGESDFAGCTETRLLNYNSYNKYNVYVEFSGKLISGKIDIYLVDGEWIDAQSSNVIVHYEYLENGDFKYEYTFDKVPAKSSLKYVIVGSDDLKVRDFKMYSTEKIKIYDKIFNNKIEMIYP